MNHIRFNMIGKSVFALFLSTIMMALLAPALNAGNNDPGPAATQAQDSQSGIHIGRTKFFLGGHAGINFPNAASDLFDMVTRELTLEKKDFRSPCFGIDFGIAIQSHYAVVFSWEYSQASPVSESRPYVDENGNPIVQTTRFRQMPFTATFRYYPWKTGEEVGSYVWIPARFSPYIAGGGGFMHYNFRQEGSFVNTNPNSPNYLDIFEEDLESKGTAAMGHLSAGFDINITSRIFANFEARYVFSHKALTEDFILFEPIDLKGLRTTGGIFFRF
jgi:hypothetical protein